MLRGERFVHPFEMDALTFRWGDPYGGLPNPKLDFHILNQLRKFFFTFFGA